MAKYTLTFAQSQLDKYVLAEDKVLSGQSYSIGGRSLTRANLADIREAIEYWASQVESISSGTGRVVMWRIIVHG
jgi:hypothetical protein